MLIWIYNENKEPIIIDEEDFTAYESNGWVDSPIKFINITDAGIDVDDQMAVEAFGLSITGVKNSMNDALNIDDMTKDDLVEYASTHHGCELEPHRRESTLRNQAYALAYGE